MADETNDTETTAAPAATVLDPSLSGDGVRLDAPGLPEGKPLKDSDAKGKVTVRTRYPIDVFEHGLKDIPVVTKYGVEVNRSDVKKLLEVAAANDTQLEEVKG